MAGTIQDGFGTGLAPCRGREIQNARRSNFISEPAGAFRVRELDAPGRDVPNNRPRSERSCVFIAVASVIASRWSWCTALLGIAALGMTWAVRHNSPTRPMAPEPPIAISVLEVNGGDARIDHAREMTVPDCEI